MATLIDYKGKPTNQRWLSSFQTTLSYSQEYDKLATDDVTYS